MTTNQVLLGLGLILVLAVSSFGAVFAVLLLGMSSGAALMTGAILVVSGPTVVGPLLRFVRPTERLQRCWPGRDR
jgi:NhaP-type Na+/H+ or K+/H+ antiporter